MSMIFLMHCDYFLLIVHVLLLLFFAVFFLPFHLVSIMIGEFSICPMHIYRIKTP